MTTQLRSNPSSAGKLTFSDLETTWRRDASSVKTPDLWPFDGLVNGGGGEEGTGSERAGQASALHLAAGCSDSTSSADGGEEEEGQRPALDDCSSSSGRVQG